MYYLSRLSFSFSSFRVFSRASLLAARTSSLLCMRKNRKNKKKGKYFQKTSKKKRSLKSFPLSLLSLFVCTLPLSTLPILFLCFLALAFCHTSICLFHARALLPTLRFVSLALHVLLLLVDFRLPASPNKREVSGRGKYSCTACVCA